MTTVDAEVSRLGWDGADMVKVDAEGYDCAVLRGMGRLMASRAVPVVQFEYNAAWAEAGATLTWTRGFLEGFGYDVYVLTGRGLSTIDFRRYGEWFSYANLVAVGSWAVTGRAVRDRVLAGPL